MRYGLVVIFFNICSLIPQAQCPDKTLLWHRIIYLRDSSDVSPEKQLEELMSYNKIIDKCDYANDSVHVLLLQRMGWLFTSRNDFANAINFTKQSIRLCDLQKNNPAINPGMSIKSCWNLYLMYDSLNLEDKKIEAADSCIIRSVRMNSGYEYGIAACSIIVPNIFSNGDYYKCILYADMGSSIIKRAKDSSFNDKLFTLFAWKVNSLILLNRKNEAYNELSERIKSAREHNDVMILGTLYGLYATLLSYDGQTQGAIDFFKQSYKFQKQIGFARGCAEALNNIGLLCDTSLHKTEMALLYYNQALQYATGDEKLNIMANIANVYSRNENYETAFLYFRKAFDQLKVGFTKEDLLKGNNALLDGQIVDYITAMFLDKAKTYMSMYKTQHTIGNLDSALAIYNVLDRFFDRLKLSQANVESKLFWKKNNQHLYEQAIEISFLTNNISDAFYFCEKYRSSLLRSQLTRHQRISDGELAEEAVLRQNVAHLQNDLQIASPGSVRYDLIHQQLFTARDKLEKFIKTSNIENNIQSEGYGGTNTIQQLKERVLGNSRSLIEIFYGDSAVYELVITPGKEYFKKIGKKSYDSLTWSYISFIDNRYALNNHFSDFINVSHSLYHLLFQQITLSPGSIIISPDGKSFPFEALTLNNDFRNPDYFLNHYAVSYTYSANYLTNQFSENTSDNKTVLGIAPVRYYYKDLATLTASDRSLQNIDAYFDNTFNYTFDKATKNNFLRDFPSYSIIQLYTHASDTSVYNDPVIYFSDSALYLSALLPDQKPVTQLVVLSACETANGKFYQGEGIFSFNRGFAALGIPAAVSNLWSVDNQSTYAITELFYKYLSQGLPTDIALQKAKIDFINSNLSSEKKLPYFWAASILTGKVSTIAIKQSFPWWKWSIVLLLIVVIIFIAVRFTKTKNKN